jgi:predicted aspartyl protease
MLHWAEVLRSVTTQGDGQAAVETARNGGSDSDGDVNGVNMKSVLDTRARCELELVAR